jgi:hypothetical protein
VTEILSHRNQKQTSMKNISHLFTITFCVISAHLFAQDKQDQIIATWQTREAHVEIYKVDERFIGNPINSEGERNQQIELLNLEYENGKWIGKIYSKGRDRTWDVVCEIKGDKLLLAVDAGRMSRDLEWTRVN